MSVVAAGIVAVMTFLLYNSILDERKIKIRNLVEMTHSVLVKWDKEALAGHISVDVAKENALKEINTIRYDGDNYFWINDLNSKIILHPIKPALNNKDGSNILDAEGKAIFIDFANIGKSAKGEDYVHYHWDKPSTKQPAAKLSYVGYLQSEVGKLR